MIFILKELDILLYLKLHAIENVWGTVKVFLCRLATYKIIKFVSTLWLINSLSGLMDSPLQKYRSW